jgi:hypothetical protein
VTSPKLKILIKNFYFFFIYLMQTSTEIVLQLIISYKIYSNKNKSKITWSTGLKQTIRMTKSPLTRHGIILLQTPMTETFSRQSRLQPIPEHIATHLATKTKPMTIPIKIDYCVIHRFEPAIVSAIDGKMSSAPRYAALSKGPPQIVA